MIKPDRVRSVNEFIKHFDVTSIKEFYDAEKIAKECYGGDGIKVIDDYVVSHVIKIKQAYATAAVNGHGLVIRTG